MDLNLLSRHHRLATVMDWVGGRVSDLEVERELTEMARRDPAVVADIDWARRLHQSATDLPLLDPPPLLRQRLRQQFRRWASAQGLPEPPLLELSARLVFDSRQDRLAVGMRGTGPDEGPVHLVWRTEIAELVVQARRQDNGLVRLDGQVLLAHAASAPVFEVTVHGPGIAVRAVDGDVLGRFHARVPDAVDRLVLANGEITLSAPLDLADR